MPFSSLTDPVDLARAQAALDAAWAQIEPRVDEDRREEARAQLAYAIVSQVRAALDESELTARAMQKFQERWGR